MVRIRVPEQLFVASSGYTAAPTAQNLMKQKPRELAPRDYRSRPAARESAPGAPGRGPSRRRRLELPDLPRRAQTKQTILQPQFAPDVALPAATQLPELFFWAPRKEVQQYVKPYVEPGHERLPAQPRLLDAPPRLALPTSEPAAMTVPPTPDSYEALRLVIPAALPVRTSESRAPQTGISADSAAGDPTTVLSLALDPERMREFLTVPGGNQLGQLPEGAMSGVAALTAASGGGNRSHGSGSGAGNGSGSSASAKPVESTAAASVESGAASGSPLRAMALAAAAPTRVIHPTGGVFDVVVQSTGTEGFPESSGVLSGKPVYSAYIQAGGGHDWLMQYCVPASEEVVAQVSESVVRLLTGSPLVAPYPRVTMRPPVKPRPGKNVMVQGYITVEGRFRDLKVLTASSASEAEMVLAVLEQWEFRPATRDGKPLQVEILLAIPAE